MLAGTPTKSVPVDEAGRESARMMAPRIQHSNQLQSQKVVLADSFRTVR